MFKGKRVSYLRLLSLLAVIGLLIFGGSTGWQWFKDTQSTVKEPWFAGYADVTAQPSYAFERGATPAEKHSVLAFVVNHKTETCTPTWGGHYTMDEASLMLDLDRRIARANNKDRHVVISFGGEINYSLAESCTTVPDLKATYEQIINRYDIDTVDFDIEGESLNALDANQRRATAVAQIQTERRSAGKQLAVWLTLPVGQHGLTDAGVNVLNQMLRSGVDVSGINLMTMNFNTPEAAADLYKVIISSIESSYTQIHKSYKGIGINLNGNDTWQKIGVTPMIGQSMIPAEIFTMDIAKKLNVYLVDKGVRRVSMWSANRDHTCSVNNPASNLVSNSCSGVDQGDLFFADQLGADMLGNPNAQENEETVPGPVQGVTPGLFPGGGGDEEIVDDPASSPYPIWAEGGRYAAGTKVTWKKQVYRARWWNERVQPDIPFNLESESPWEYVGPVLPGEKPIQEVKLPVGYYDSWNPETVYTRGERVMLNSNAFEAKWWTQGDSPDRTLVDPANSPWLMLDTAELLELLDFHQH